MKKILILLLFFVFNLHAYDYLIFKPTSTSNQYRYYIDEHQNQLFIKVLNVETGDISYSSNESTFYSQLAQIKRRNVPNWENSYISKFDFDNYYKNDFRFLNDLFKQVGNPFFNYLYNSDFNASNIVLYDNYELLYNTNGLAVASIVDGVWAGLYDDTTKSTSGKLYDQSGSLAYINGKEVAGMNPFDMINELLITSVAEVFGVFSRIAVYSIYLIVVIVFGIALFSVDLVGSGIRFGFGGGRRYRSSGLNYEGYNTINDYGNENKRRHDLGVIREKLQARGYNVGRSKRRFF